MLTSEQAELRRLQKELTELNTGAAHQDVREILRSQLDAVRPAEDISTSDVAKRRKLPIIGGGFAYFSHDKTPYLREVHDAMDDPKKRFVFVKGPARGAKTVSAENFLLKIGIYGPSRNVLWYMHSEPDLKRYVTERVDFFLREHEELAEKVGGRGGRAAWNLKMIDGAVWEWLPANDSTTRARSAAVIVGDEIDAMRPHIGDAIVTLVRNRQREYGNLAKAFFCSHPDRGPQFGIDALLKDSDFRLRYWTCTSCGHLMSPCAEAPAGRRVTWNVADLMKSAEEMERDAFLAFVAENVHLTCPNCKVRIDNDERLELDADGIWIGKGQEINEREEVVGELSDVEAAGFVIHGFMLPWKEASLAALAREWAGSMLTKLETGSDALLRQVHVKSLGETHRDDDIASIPKVWTEFKAAHLDTSYTIGTVPRGVDFLTAMTDVQGNRFETGVWGWSRNRECWLIDRFALKQRLGLKEIAPGERLEDWDVLEYVLKQTYPLNDGSGRHLGIAKMAVDTGGVPGVAENAVIWASNLLAAAKAEPWRIMLSKGDRHLQGQLYGKVNKITEDHAGRPLPVPVNLRVINVSEVKRTISRRMATTEPGPLFIHLPKDVEDRHVKELVSETLINGEWVRNGRNETWDTLIMSEVARSLLAPENVAIDWVNDRPIFAVPFIPSSSNRGEDDNQPEERDFFSRLSRVNKGR